MQAAATTPKTTERFVMTFALQLKNAGEPCLLLTAPSTGSRRFEIGHSADDGEHWIGSEIGDLHAHETRRAGLGAVFVAVPVSPVLTALIEAAWCALVRHIDLWKVPDANFDPDIAFCPSAHVAASGVAFLGVALALRSPAPRRSAVIAVQPASR